MGERLDRRLRACRPELSWTRIRDAIERGQVTVDGVLARDPAREVTASAVVAYDPARRALPTARLDLPRLHEDATILVVDKPSGLLTIASSPEAKATEDTVLRRAQDYARRLHGRGGYAGVLHRLDRFTSGTLALALSREAHMIGRAMFGEHRFDRRYLALVGGEPRVDEGTIDARISSDYVSGRRTIVRGSGGRRAVTHFRVRERLGAAALVELRLETGRQHQIRLHLRELGHPILGDAVYGNDADAGSRVGAGRPLLHAWRLQFPHPLGGGTVRAEAPLPGDFERALARMRRRHLP